MTLSTVSLKTKLIALAGLFLLGLASFGFLAYTTITEVKIGGATYQTISLSGDVLGDFAAPTQFVIQERLDVMLMLAEIADKARVATLIDDFKTGAQAFDDGHKQWLTRLSDSKETELAQKAYETGHTYLAIVSDKYIPLIQQGNADAAEKVRIAELVPVFDLHKTAVDDFVKLMTAQKTTAEANAQSMVSSRSVMLTVVALAAIGIVLGFCLVIAKGILTPL